MRNPASGEGGKGTTTAAGKRSPNASPAEARRPPCRSASALVNPHPTHPRSTVVSGEMHDWRDGLSRHQRIGKRQGHTGFGSFRSSDCPLDVSVLNCRSRMAACRARDAAMSAPPWKQLYAWNMGAADAEIVFGSLPLEILGIGPGSHKNSRQERQKQCSPAQHRSQHYSSTLVNWELR